MKSTASKPGLRCKNWNGSFDWSSLFNFQFFAIGNNKGNIGTGNQPLVDVVVVSVVFLFLFWPKRIPLSLPLFAGVVRLIQACTSYYIASRNFWCRSAYWVLPWVLACDEDLRRKPTRLRPTGNRAWRASGTQGSWVWARSYEFMGTCDFLFTLESKPLKATSLQKRSLCFVPADKKSKHWLLF